MLRKSFTLLVLALACASTALLAVSPRAETPETDPPKTSQEKVAKPKLGVVDQRIVGGGPAAKGQDRWITSIQFGQQHFCGASLIDSRWVLTAAHCVIGENAADIQVWVGGNNLRQEGQGIRRNVKRIIMHEAYDDNTVDNDIALLELVSDVPSQIKPVSLPTAATMNAAAGPGHVVTVSGWGALSEGGNSPNRLHEVLVPVVSNTTCNSPQAYGGGINPQHICAGLKNGGKDSCQGDSGGPLWTNHANQSFVVGIVSFGDGCAQPNKYGVYTRVQQYLPWIQQQTSGAAGDGDSGSGGGDGDSGSGGGECQSSDGLCRKLVCTIDSYCCETEYDSICKSIEKEECSL